MADLITVVREWMLGNEWELDTLTVAKDGAAQLHYQSSGNGETYNAYLDVDPGTHWVEMIHYLPGKVPEKRRGPVAELLTHLNGGVRLGNFDLLMPDGRVRYRTGVDMEDGELSIKMLENMERANCSFIDQHYAAIMSVAFADHSPEQAMAKLKGEAIADEPEAGWLPGSGNLSDWSAYPETRCLQAWVGEAKTLLTEGGDAENWEMLGHGLVIVHKDIERARDMFHRIAIDAGMQFVHVPASSVLDLSLGVIDPFRSLSPALVLLEKGAWLSPVKEQDAGSDEAQRGESLRARLAERMRAFDPGHPVIYATAVRDIGDLEAELRSVGVFDRRFSIPDPSAEFLGNDFIDRIGRDKCDQDFLDVPIKVGTLISGHESNRTRELAIQAMKRLAKRERRQLRFLDLVNFETRGTMESDLSPPESDEIRRQVAYHEAGHALVAILDSQGTNIPEYSSIVASSTFKGVVVRSMSYLYSHESQETYRDFVHSIRIGLGGRAGEQLLVGSENVSSGASGDLESATRQCYRAFAYYGFSPGMEDASRAGTNLAVVYGTPSSSEYAHIETLTRSFLGTQYQSVLEILSANRSMLDAIAERLLWDPILDQNELAQLVSQHGVELLNGSSHQSKCVLEQAASQ